MYNFNPKQVVQDMNARFRSPSKLSALCYGPDILLLSFFRVLEVTPNIKVVELVVEQALEEQCLETWVEVIWVGLELLVLCLDILALTLEVQDLQGFPWK